MMSGADASLVLVGPMAAGKTSVGRKAARLLQVPFLDSDRLIVAAHGPIPEIFASEGEPRFREIERETIAANLGSPGVFALGGGAVTDAQTRQALKAHPVVFLTVAPEAVSRRLRAGGRPLLEGEEDPVERWKRIFAERRDWYEQVADLQIDTSRVPMGQVAEQIAQWWRKKDQ